MQLEYHSTISVAHTKAIIFVHSNWYGAWCCPESLLVSSLATATMCMLLVFGITVTASALGKTYVKAPHNLLMSQG